MKLGWRLALFLTNVSIGLRMYYARISFISN